MADPFDSAWLKWGWAVREAEALEVDIDAFGNDLRTDGLGRTRCDYQPKSHRFAVVLESVKAEFPPRWGMRLGNVVHNYRSCLDHIAWAVVERGHTPPTTLRDEQQRRVGFPICSMRSHFNNSIKGRLPGVRRADIAKVRRYQPYKHGKLVRKAHALVILDRLSRFDKHRTIQPVASFPFGGNIEVTYLRDCVVSRQSKRNPSRKLEVGAEFAYVYVRKTGPKPKMNVKADMTVKPSIDYDFWLNEWLHKTGERISLILSQFSDPPTKLLKGLEGPT